jgi:hypothetical protein
MARKRRSTICYACLFWVVALGFHVPVTQARAQGQPPKSRLILWDLSTLDHYRRLSVEKPTQFPDPVKATLNKANIILTQTIPTILDKSVTAPSGDKHDYLSVQMYYWPDPTKPGGIPYISRDGVRNPETDNKFPDRRHFDQVLRNVPWLARAAYITGQLQYKDQALKYVRTWFIAPQTRMNPNLNYAGFPPGARKSDPSSIVEIHSLPEFLEGVRLLEVQNAFTPAEEEALHNWMRSLLVWLRTSTPGKIASMDGSNRGIHYEAVVSALALYVGDRESVIWSIEETKKRHLNKELAADGSLPQELRRSNSLGYSRFALEGLFEQATYASSIKIDLWHYKAPNGAGIRSALDFIFPYLVGEQKWPYQQIEPIPPANYFALLYQAESVYRDGKYKPYIHNKAMSGHYAYLIYPGGR